MPAPLWPGSVVYEEIVVQATIAGTVETFDQESYKANLAESLDVTTDEISLAVSPASVIVVATIRPTSASVEAVEAAATALVESSDVSAQLGVAVEVIDHPIKKQVVIPAPSAPPPPPSPPPFEATCFEVSGACAQFGEEDTCNSHFRMFDAGSSRKCLWKDEDDSCTATGEQYDTIPPCASGDFMPPPPASPPAFSCYTPVSDAGYEYCYELPKGTACDGYFQFNENSELFLVCGFHETTDGKCIGAAAMGEDAVRSAAPPEPLCSATPSPPPATDAIVYECQNAVTTQGVDWCWELPDFAPCGSFYQFNPTAEVYAQCVDVPNKEGQCRGGSEKLDSPPECSPPTPPDPPAPPPPPPPGCYVDIAVYGLEWCFELRTGGETTYRPCDVHYKFNANKGIYKGCAAHPTKANQCTGGDVEWTSVPECSPPSAPPAPTTPGTSWCFRPTSALGADWCYELELGEGECELYYQTSGHGHRKCEYDAAKGRCIRSATEVTVDVPEPTCSAPY